MGSGDADSRAADHAAAQCLGIGEGFDPAVLSSEHLGVVRLDRGGGDHEVTRIGKPRTGLVEIDVDTLGFEGLGRGGGAQV